MSNFLSNKIKLKKKVILYTIVTLISNNTCLYSKAFHSLASWDQNNDGKDFNTTLKTLFNPSKVKFHTYNVTLMWKLKQTKNLKTLI